MLLLYLDWSARTCLGSAYHVLQTFISGPVELILPVWSPINDTNGIHINFDLWLPFDDLFELKLSVSLTIMGEDYLQTCKNRRSASRVVRPSFRPSSACPSEKQGASRPSLSFFPDGFAWLFEFPSILPGLLQIPNSSASRSVGRSVGPPSGSGR